MDTTQAIKKLEKAIESLAIAQAELAHTVRVIKQSQTEAAKKELNQLFKPAEAN